MKFTLAEWELGILLALQTKDGLRAILLGTHEANLINEVSKKFPQAQYTPTDNLLHSTMKKLIHYTQKPTGTYEGSLDLQGTAFQKAVWNVIRTIPAGDTMTYAKVAACIGKPDTYRAVANACGANLLPLVIPCHRVVGTQGLGGYRFGISLKRELLAREQEDKKHK